MNPFEFSIPQNIIVGAGTLAKLPECAKKMGGTHAMILSGPTLKKMGVVDKAADSLKAAGIAADIFTDIEANPSVTTVEKATESYLASGADFLVALGGGSPMDVAKAVGVTAKYGGSITEYEGAHKVPGKIVPLIAIARTAGTGSEVTAFSVITDHSRDYKLTVFSGTFNFRSGIRCGSLRYRCLYPCGGGLYFHSRISVLRCHGRKSDGIDR